MDRDNQVIEKRESRVRRTRGRRFGFSPRQALYHNDHPEAIVEDFDRSDYGAVLREVELHDREGAPADARAGRVGLLGAAPEPLVDWRGGERRSSKPCIPSCVKLGRFHRALGLPREQPSDDGPS